MRVLIIEDEKRLSTSLKKGLVESGFAIDQAFDGEEGLFLGETENYDCIILDLMLPKLDGITILKKLREKQLHVPILILTAKNSVEDVSSGLDAGADDYLTKPFSFMELKSRLAALIRRGHQNPSPVLKIADLEVDTVKHVVTRANQSIVLTPKEFSILEFLLRHQGEVVTRTMIIEHVWDYNFESISNVVDVFIASLRKKIDKNANTKLIYTLHGTGFKIAERP